MVALLVLASVLVFVVIDLLIRRSRRQKEALAPKQAKPPVADNFLIPGGYFFGRGHSWVKLLQNGTVRIGIDDFVQKLVGPIDALSLAPLQSKIRKGETLVTIRQGKRSLSLPSPISGRISSLNTSLVGKPSLVNDDPYTDGWVAMIEPSNLSSELPTTTIADGAAQWLKNEVARFRDFLQDAVSRPDRALVLGGETLLDGGEPVQGVLRMTDDGTWHSFEQKFLLDI